MKQEEMKTGKVYLLKGGLLLRCRGLYGGTGPCFAFGGIREDQDGPAVGYSADAPYVLREVTLADLEWLKERRLNLVHRDMFTYAEDIDFLIEELRC